MRAKPWGGIQSRYPPAVGAKEGAWAPEVKPDSHNKEGALPPHREETADLPCATSAFLVITPMPSWGRCCVSAGHQGATVMPTHPLLRSRRAGCHIVAAAGHRYCCSPIWPSRHPPPGDRGGRGRMAGHRCALVGPLAAPGARRAAPAMIRRRAGGKILVMGSATSRPARHQACVELQCGPRLRKQPMCRRWGWRWRRAQRSGSMRSPRTSWTTPPIFPPEVQASPRFQERLQRRVPLGLAWLGPRRDAAFAAYAMQRSDSCFVGQVFPVCGGWVR